MRATTVLLVGTPSGGVRLYCDRWGCDDWHPELPPHSSLLDVERAMKTHTHPRKDAA